MTMRPAPVNAVVPTTWTLLAWSSIHSTSEFERRRAAQTLAHQILDHGEPPAAGMSAA